MFTKHIEELSKKSQPTTLSVGSPVNYTGTTKDAPFFDLLSLSIFLGENVNTLLALEKVNCMGCYHTYYINKKTKKIVPRDFPGNLREINSPINELKIMQKKLGKVFEKFPYHDANKGFIAGRGIKDAIEAVKEGETLIHFDIEKFFDNHSALFVKSSIKEFYKNIYGVTLDNITLNVITALLCKDNKLPQGSPASPVLVVVLNKELDDKMQAIADKYNLVYARYADDLSFSGTIDNTTLNSFIEEVTEGVHPFKINYKKLGIMRHSARPILQGVRVTFDKPLNSVQIGNIKNAIRNTLEATSYTFFVKSTGGAPKVLQFYSKELNSVNRKDVEELMNKISGGVAKATTLEFTLKPLFYYIQSTKHLLGANIQDGKVNFPRKEYENLRLIAMLMGRQRAMKAIEAKLLSEELGPDDYPRNSPTKTSVWLESLLSVFSSNGRINTIKNNNTTSYRNLLNNPLNRKVFNGMLAHIKNIDPTKYEKLVAIEKKANEKAKEEFTSLAARFDLKPWLTNIN